MPYILVRGKLRTFNQQDTRSVLVNGLKISDLEQLKRFDYTSDCGDGDKFAIAFKQHPCVILTALEVLGYKVVSSSSCANNKLDNYEYMWTMRKEFSEPEPEPTLEKEDF